MKAGTEGKPGESQFNHNGTLAREAKQARGLDGKSMPLASGAMHHLRVASALCLLSIAGGGCAAYLPPLTHQFNAKDLRRLEVGHTTRPEAEKRLRRYHALRRTDRILICEQSRHAGYYLIAAGYNGVAGKLVTQRYRILAGFDSLGVLERLDVEPQRRERRPVPGADTVASPLPAPSDTMVVRRSRPGSWFDRGKRFRCVAVGPGSRIAAVDADARLWLWSDGSARNPYVLTIPHRGTIRRVEFSPDGRRLACLSKELAMFDLSNFEGAGLVGSATPLWSMDKVTAMACAPDRLQVAVATSRKEVRILEAATGREIRSWRVPGHHIGGLAWSDDGRWLATSGTSTVKLWYMAGRGVDPPAEAARFDAVGAIRFSPDGRILALNRGTHVELWNVAHVGAAFEPDSVPPLPQLMDAFLLPYESANTAQEEPSLISLAFSPDSRELAATNGGLVVYDLARSRRSWVCGSKGKRGVGKFVDPAFDGSSERLLVATNRGLYGWLLTERP